MNRLDKAVILEMMGEAFEKNGGDNKCFMLLQIALFKVMTEEQQIKWLEEANKLGLVG